MSLLIQVQSNPRRSYVRVTRTKQQVAEAVRASAARVSSNVLRKKLFEINPHLSTLHQLAKIHGPV
jgi:hypothetical protein